jgi:vacuolar-type H+-ATPase subunit E/Vma4
MKKTIKDLEKKILNKASSEAEQLISKAKKAKERIIKAALEDAKKIEIEAKKKGTESLDLEKKIISSEKIIDERKEYLLVRDKIFEQLIHDLEGVFQKMLDNGRFRSWIKSKCIEIVNAEKEKMILVTRKEDKKTFEQIIKGIKDLSLNDELMERGFLLRSEKNEYDFRFNVLARNLVHENSKMILSKLDG